MIVNETKPQEKKLALYNKHNFTIARFASKEEDRYSINAILVSEDRTTATDGHRMLEVTASGLDRKDFPNVPGVSVAKNGERFLFPAEAALQLAKQIPKKQSIPVLQTAAPLEPVKDDKGVMQQVGFVTTDLEQVNPVTVRAVTGIFPNVDTTWPQADKKTALKFALNARYLKEMAGWFQEFKGDPERCAVTITVYDSSSAVLFEAENDEGQKARALILPMRLD